MTFYNYQSCAELHFRYGSEYLSAWKFESWNEPDHGDWCGLNFTLSSYTNYVDASITAIRLSSINDTLQVIFRTFAVNLQHFLAFR